MYDSDQRTKFCLWHTFRTQRSQIFDRSTSKEPQILNLNLHHWLILCIIKMTSSLIGSQRAFSVSIIYDLCFSYLVSRTISTVNCERCHKYNHWDMNSYPKSVLYTYLHPHESQTIFHSRTKAVIFSPAVFHESLRYYSCPVPIHSMNNS